MMSSVRNDRPQDSGKESQRPVAGVVAVGVVEALEVVEITHREGERSILAKQHVHLVLERPPIQQPGQRIGGCLKGRRRHDTQHAEPGAGPMLRSTPAD